ncbi:efflux RND transporter permease subunit [Pseudoduganella plicata]|uniref:Efflux RND transporter permease subunit n=1 Tax=Pseudoduganella plicata TaxID=321984 RepID=A0ABX5S564_9BURK|nr:efflux RND transporter permease subunit [Pseudoduganella plicata]
MAKHPIQRPLPREVSRRIRAARGHLWVRLWVRLWGPQVRIALGAIVRYLPIVVNFQSWLDPAVIVSALPAAPAGIVWMLSVPALTGAIMCRAWQPRASSAPLWWLIPLSTAGSVSGSWSSAERQCSCGGAPLSGRLALRAHRPAIDGAYVARPRRAALALKRQQMGDSTGPRAGRRSSSNPPSSGKNK